jgi:soluble lytic murein transglycosylase-like protein
MKKFILFLLTVFIMPLSMAYYSTNNVYKTVGITEAASQVFKENTKTVSLTPRLVKTVYKQSNSHYTHDDYLLANIIKERYTYSNYNKDLVISHYINKYTKGLVWPSPLDVASIIEIESQYNENSVSDCGAKGLMQISPMWSNRINPLAYTSVKYNIKYGIHILSYYYGKYDGNISAAILSYNSGDHAYNLGKAWPVYWYRYISAHHAFDDLYQHTI